MKKIISIFGSSRSPLPDDLYESAFSLGKELARKNFIVCNGGYGGTMEVVARGAKEAGGRTIGITSEAFSSRTNSFIDQEISVVTHIDRLMKLISIADGYIVLQGGTGTMLEFVTVWEYFNKNLMKSKPIIFLGEYWKEVIASIQRALQKEKQMYNQDWFMIVSEPKEAVEHITQYFSSNKNS